MPDPTTAKDFILNSDYPPEKVVYKRSGTVSVNAHATHANAQMWTFPHGLGFAPLCRGAYKWNTSFEPLTHWVELGTTYYLSAAPMFLCAAYSDDTNVYLYIWNQSGASTTISYRIVGFTDPAISASVEPLPSLGGSMLFDTDKNYLKVVGSGAVDIPINSSSTIHTINHGLGYIPNCYAWVLSPSTNYWGAVQTENFIGNTGFVSSLVVSSTQLKIDFFAFMTAGTARFVYRIFADE